MMNLVYKSQASLTNHETTLGYILLNIVKLHYRTLQGSYFLANSGKYIVKKACSFVPYHLLCSSVNPQSKPAKFSAQCYM